MINTDKMSDDEYFEYFATLLGKKVYVSKEFVKSQLYSLNEGDRIDPWLQHIMLTEAFNVIVQQAAMIKPMVMKKY